MHGSPSAPPEQRWGAAPEPGRGRHAGRQKAHRRPLAAALAAVGLLGLCAGTAGVVWAKQTGHPAPRVSKLSKSGIPAIPRGRWAAVPEPSATGQVAKPASLVIPSIGVKTKLVRLGRTSSGAMQVPATAAVAGWYTGSPRPGATGAAVIAGHIDSQSGPGIFYRLRFMHSGELIYVRRGDGSLAVFRVTAVHTYLKAAFPTNAVYGAVPNAQLRLITCGGTFDFSTGHYLSNVIVFATLRH